MDFLKNDSDCSTGGGGLSEKNNRSFNHLCENIRVGLAIVDNEGNCLKVNSRLCEILGYSEAELFGAGFGKLIWSAGSGIDAGLQEKTFLENFSFQNEEKCCFKKDGSKIWVRILTFFRIDPENRPIYAVFYIENMNRQKETENSFAVSGKDFDSVFENVNDGITISEQVGKFLEVNRIVCEKVGYSKEELLEKTASEFVSSEASKLFARQVRELYRTGQAAAQTTVVRKDGALLPVELSMRLIEYRGKHAVFSIVREIKDREKVEQMLKRQKDGLLKYME